MEGTTKIVGASGPAMERGRGSISFVVTAPERLDRARSSLAIIRSRFREGDEVFVVTGIEPAKSATSADSWYSVVTIPHASSFAIRAQVPAICRNEWVIVLEDHALIEPCAIDSIRKLICAKPELDMIVFLAKNLTSVSRWGWAIFLFNFTLIWAPLDAPPPFSAVTSAVVRRAKFENETPLEEGVWELRLIPKIFSEGKIAYSNDIFFDHVKPVNFVSAVILEFHNARAGAAIQRKLGTPVRNIIYEGFYCAGSRPGILAKAAAHRLHELPAGTFQRVRVVSCAHLIGYIIGSIFGGGRSAHKI
jgi:hypothetical protein